MSRYEFGEKLEQFIQKYLECEERVSATSGGIFTSENSLGNKLGGDGYYNSIFVPNEVDREDTVRLLKQFLEQHPELKEKVELQRDPNVESHLTLFIGGGFNDGGFDTENAMLIDQALTETMNDEDFKFTPTRTDCLLSHDDTQPLKNIIKPTAMA